MDPWVPRSFIHGSCAAWPQTHGAPDSFQWDWRLLVTSLVAMIAGAMSASVGVGGGGVYVPLFMAVACLPTKGAIPVSKVCILGIAITTFIINFTKRHPKADRPLINYSVAFLLAPTTILGTVFGIMLFIVFPQWFIVILLVLVLGVTDYRTIIKALELHRKEQAEHKAILGANVNVDPADVAAQPDFERRNSMTGTYGALSDSNGSDGSAGMGAGLSDESSNGGDVEHAASSPTTAAKLLKLESMTPVHKIMGLVFLWLCMLMLVMIRGGGDSKSDVTFAGIEKCSWSFWLLTVALAIILWTGAAIGVLMQWRRTQALKTAGVPKVAGDVEWTPLKFAGFVLVGCFAGTCAGFLGIGAGLINTPYMLEVGMSPEVAAATSSFVIIFTAMSTVIQYIIAGLMPLKSAAWYGSLGLVSAVIGQFAVGALVRKYKKASIISFLLAGLITMSAIGLVALAVFNMVENRHNKSYWKFHDYCNPEGTPKHGGDLNGVQKHIESSNQGWWF